MLDREDDEGRHVLHVGEVHSLPLGRRLGLVSAADHEAVIAFVGADADWSGGVAVRVGESVTRGGLTLTLERISACDGQAKAEFDVSPVAAASV